MIVKYYIDETQVKEVLLKHQYNFIRKIGEGAFATVFLAESLKYANNNFVVKRVDFRSSPGLMEKDIDPEIESLMHLHHPNIIAMYDFFRDDQALYIVFQYCPEGSLKDKLEEHGPLDTSCLCNFGKQILNALNECHKNNIAHRDIKPANILVDSYGRAQLADFGLAQSFSQGAKTHAVAGSIAFMAPEMLSDDNYDPFKTDIWALGVTFYNLSTGTFPWKLKNRNTLEESIKHDKIIFNENNNIDRDLQRIILSMCSKNPNERPSIQELLDEPCFKPKASIRSIKSFQSTAFPTTDFQKSYALKADLIANQSSTNLSRSTKDTPIKATLMNVANCFYFGLKNPANPNIIRPKKSFSIMPTFKETL